MFCTKCGKQLDQNGQCPQCNPKKGILSKVPGFRTNKTWKKIVSVVLHVLIICYIFVGMNVDIEYCVTGMDKTLTRIENTVFLTLIIFIPYIVVTDLFNVSKHLPFFKNWIWRVVCLPVPSFLVFMIYALIVMPMVEANFSSEYLVAQEARELAYQEAEREEDAKEQALAEERAEQERIEKEKKAEKAAAKANEQEAVVETTKEPEKKPEPQVEEVDEPTTRELTKTLTSALKDDRYSDVVSLVEDSSNTDFKEKAGKEVDEWVIKQVRKYEDEIIDDEDIALAGELYELLKPLNAVTEAAEARTVLGYLNTITASKQVMDTLDQELGDFNPDRDPIDLTQLYDLDVYVQHRIKNSSDFLNDLNDIVGNHSDNYYATTYEYLFGEAFPNDNWECIVVPSQTEFTKSGVYYLQAVQSGSMTLINSQGFERDVTVYREVSQEDISYAYSYDQLYDKYLRQYDYRKKVEETLELLADAL